MGIQNHALQFAPAAQDAGGRRNLAGLSREELAEALGQLGLEAFRARQVWHWIYWRGATSFDVMTTLAKPVRTLLAEHFSIRRPEAARDMKSKDGTRKWLLRMEDGQEIESVHIPEEDRGTLCVSSQVGCTLTCHFCHTGTQRLVRNLEATEIVGQVMLARDMLGEWPSSNDGHRLLSNIVMMGMGEP
ncbi:MAG: 23S rRNA (adenine(2503)-C(2))-methyltransferase RlmN, partial [Pseudomonadota bacterium]|nr:23S rRNA (adenine(2503)-C(2))-methyltransferase RlmN [Pseudomonadota bacterium]